MKGVVRTVFLVCLFLSITAFPSFAADSHPGFTVKAFVFDNDTGGDLTTASKNVGLRLIITNLTSVPLELSNLQLNRLMLTRMEQSLPTDVTPSSQDLTISWPLSYMNPYGPQNIVIDSGLSSLIKGTVLPVRKASDETSHQKVRALKAGYYFPSLTIDAYDPLTWRTFIYAVAAEPVEVK